MYPYRFVYMIIEFIYLACIYKVSFKWTLAIAFMNVPIHVQFRTYALYMLEKGLGADIKRETSRILYAIAYAIGWRVRHKDIGSFRYQLKARINFGVIV